jgi:hypothetical protein
VPATSAVSPAAPKNHAGRGGAVVVRVVSVVWVEVPPEFPQESKGNRANHKQMQGARKRDFIGVKGIMEKWFRQN